MHDKNAEVPKNALKNIDPNMGLSQMAFQSALDNRQKDLQEVFFTDSYNIATNRFKLKDHKPSKHPTPVAWKAIITSNSFKFQQGCENCIWNSKTFLLLHHLGQYLNYQNPCQPSHCH